MEFSKLNRLAGHWNYNMLNFTSNISAHSIRTVVLVCALLSWRAANAQEDVATSATGISDVPRIIDADSLSRFLAVLDARRGSVPSDLWQKVGRTICDDGVHLTARIALLDRAEQAPPGVFAEIVRGVRAAATAPKEPGTVRSPASLEIAVRMLVRTGKISVYRSAGVAEEIWILANDAAELKWVDFGVVPALARVIAEWPAQAESRSRAAFALIGSYGDTMDMTGWSIFDAVLEPEFDRLRATLRNAPLRFDTLPRGSLAAVVTRGDNEVIEYLETCVQRCSSLAAESSDTAARQSYRYLGKTLAESAQLIRLQSDGNQLVQWATRLGDASPEVRVWALAKARRMGAKDAAIREAVLEYAKQVLQDTAARAAGGKTQKAVSVIALRELVAPLKQGMIEAGVMSQHDLPDLACTPEDLHDRAYLHLQQIEQK